MSNIEQKSTPPLASRAQPGTPSQTLWPPVGIITAPTSTHSIRAELAPYSTNILHLYPNFNNSMWVFLPTTLHGITSSKDSLFPWSLLSWLPTSPVSPARFLFLPQADQIKNTVPILGGLGVFLPITLFQSPQTSNSTDRFSLLGTFASVGFYDNTLNLFISCLSQSFFLASLCSFLLLLWPPLWYHIWYHIQHWNAKHMIYSSSQHLV